MEENQSSVNEKLIIYIMTGVIIIILSYIGYLYATKDLLKKGVLEKEFIKRGDITFNELPYNIQNKYINRKDYSSAKVSQPKIIEKIVEVTKEIEKEVEKIVKVKVVKEVMVPTLAIDKTKFNTFTCKTLTKRSIDINQQCIRDLNIFLNKNSKARVFEVIGLVDNREFSLISKLEDVYGKTKVKKLSLYTQIGLSRQRVIEASWIIKKHLGSFVKIDTVNYSVTLKNRRGFIVRAYK